MLITKSSVLVLVSILILLVLIVPWVTTPTTLSRSSSLISDWKDYTLSDAAAHVAKNQTIIVCTVSQPFLPFLNNWLISVSRRNHQDKVLVFAEDYTTLYKVNARWPGHAVLVPPALDAQTAQDYGSQGFFNFTSRRPRHLLHLLELGYNVMYNDVDMVWLADPFPYLQGKHDVYFTDDMPAVKPLNHSHDLPHPNSDGKTNICSCMIFLRPTNGAKLVMEKWIDEFQAQSWSKENKANDQPAFNAVLMKSSGLVDLYLLPQAAFPTGNLYFGNPKWVQKTKGKHVIIHNNWILGFENKLKRFREYGLWLVDDYAQESPLGRL